MRHRPEETVWCSCAKPSKLSAREAEATLDEADEPAGEVRHEIASPLFTWTLCCGRPPINLCLVSAPPPPPAHVAPASRLTIDGRCGTVSQGACGLCDEAPVGEEASEQ